jgi:hypothetical protein
MRGYAEDEFYKALGKKLEAHRKGRGETEKQVDDRLHKLGYNNGRGGGCGLIETATWSTGITTFEAVIVAMAYNIDVMELLPTLAELNKKYVPKGN